MGDDTVFLSDGEMYDLIVEVVGDETSLEFCTLSDHYLDDNDLDLSMRANGTTWEDIQPLVDEIEEKASEKRSLQTGTDR
jgi:hypothetical protein